VRADGTVKVLDFGLAEAGDTDVTGAAGGAGAGGTEAGATGAVTSPAMTHLRQGYGGQATEIGMILGTAAYGSPEQAKGKPVDKRAYIWAFGRLIARCLERDPNRRLRDIGDVFGELEETTADPENARVRTNDRDSSPIVLLTAGLIAGLGAGVVLRAQRA
jgi:hypothetical protein